MITQKKTIEILIHTVRKREDPSLLWSQTSIVGKWVGIWRRRRCVPFDNYSLFSLTIPEIIKIISLSRVKTENILKEFFQIRKNVIVSLTTNHRLDSYKAQLFQLGFLQNEKQEQVTDYVISAVRNGFNW